MCHGLCNVIEHLIRNGQLHQYCTPTTGANAIEVHGQILTVHGGASRFPPRQPSAKRQCTNHLEILEIQRGVTTTPSTWDQVSFYKRKYTINCHHNKPFIINVQVDHYRCHRALVDIGAAPLVSDRLSVSVGTSPCRVSITARFLIVDCPSSYNLILGRGILWGLQCFIAGHMLLMKVPTPRGIHTIQEDRTAIEHCHLNAIQQGRGAYEMLPLSPSESIDDPRDDLEGKDKKKQAPRPNPAEDTEWVSLSPSAPERKVRIATNLDRELHQKLITFLQDKQTVFVWSYADMPDIFPDVITHKLNILKDYPPVKQKRRAFNLEKYRAIQAKVQRLKEIKFIREISYPTWVSNVVMVPKPNGKWRMCVDYTNLNKACPMDSFPLPRIDQLVDSTVGFKMLSFLDAYSGYNQIKMHPTDQEHTTFVTDKGLYCYEVMPFGLKNAGATYQRLVNAMSEEEIGEVMEVYVDDMLVKRKTDEDRIANLDKVFTKL
ncbi:PREDICTED: uncharacterized protein LOC101303281 [Fragaria vesca subsp. vesca]